MGLKNTTSNYGAVAKYFHWFTAVLFLLAYASVYFRRWFTEPDTGINWLALQIHLSVGITVFVVVVLRIYWRITNIQPDPEPGTRLEHLAAHAGHLAIYAVMIVAVVTGYFGTGVATEYFMLFDIPKFADTVLHSMMVTVLGVTFEQIEPSVDFIHKQVLGKWLIWILIAGHAGAAMFHHFIKRDRTLLKMTIGRG